METKTFSKINVKFVLVLMSFLVITVNSFCQKDTLHLYYSGMQTAVSDSNDAKLTKWAATLKGKHADVEIYTYYDNSEFKKYMAERAENLNLVVIRKARDYITIKSYGPVKGKKSQRTVADVVFRYEGIVIAQPSNSSSSGSKNTNTTSSSNSNSSATSGTKTDSKKSNDTKPSEEKKESAPAANGTVGKNAGKKGDEGKIIKYDSNKEYLDSTYVNGVLKITKRKKSK